MNVQEIWDAAKQNIRMEVSEISYNTWIDGLCPITIYQDKFVLETPNQFIQKNLQERYTTLFISALSQVTGRPMEPFFLLSGEIQQLQVGESAVKTMLNPKYTFATFVTGNSNRFAHAAALAVAENPSDAYNPFFIYGGVGLGKTHLMHAIGHHILEQEPTMNLLYISSEMFTNDLIDAIASGPSKNNEFRARYRNVDVLLIDDIQFIAGKERTQEEFFHTFNALHEANKQIIVSSDKQPKEIPQLENRLRSRFEWGLIADIQRPDLETRIAILRKKAELEYLDVPEDVNVFIANKAESSIRELEGFQNKVVAYARLIGKQITLKMAEEVLHDMLPIKDPKRITADTVMAVVSEYYSVSKGDLIGQKRNREITLPRQIAMYLLREVVDQSYPQIGGAFGGRDHTTVLHAYNKIAMELQDNPRMRTVLEDLTKRLMQA